MKTWRLCLLEGRLAVEADAESETKPHEEAGLGAGAGGSFSECWDWELPVAAAGANLFWLCPNSSSDFLFTSGVLSRGGLDEYDVTGRCVMTGELLSGSGDVVSQPGACWLARSVAMNSPRPRGTAPLWKLLGRILAWVPPPIAALRLLGTNVVKVWRRMLRFVGAVRGLDVFADVSCPGEGVAARETPDTARFVKRNWFDELRSFVRNPDSKDACFVMWW